MFDSNKKVDIPEEFYSFDSKSKFEHCIECDKYLLHDDVDYFIEKAVKKYDGFTAHDVIFEYAICIECAEKMRKSMSKESLEKLESYFLQNINAFKRLDLIESDSEETSEWFDECLVSGKRRYDINEYQLFAQCRGGQMVLGQMPYMISGEILENISELLSKETKDELDDFSRRHFGPPPELEEPLPFRRVLIV